jgi:hypothetical protein
MTKLIIRDASDLAEHFENYPTRTYGRTPSYSLADELARPKQSTGYTRVQRAAERINSLGQNMRTDEVLSMENWDLVSE